MNTDDRFTSYFTARSAEIPVHGAGTPAIAARAQRRRHRRNGVKIGAVVAVLAIGGGLIARTDDPGQPVASGGSAIVPSNLDWTTVVPRKAIGSLGDQALTEDGTLYGISTSPRSNAAEPDGTGGLYELGLYRSKDGAEWNAVALPDGMSATHVSASGDRVYATGTAPAGGGLEQVRLATSRDGTWSTTEVPVDLAALGADFPGKVVLTGTEVAVGPDGTAVVAVSVLGLLADDVRPDGAEPLTPHRVRLDGIELSDLSDCPSSAADGAGTAGGTATSSSTTTTTTIAGNDGPPEVGVPTTVDQERAQAIDNCEMEGKLKPGRLYTWAELGVTPEAGALAQGRTYLFAAGPDEPLVAAGELPGQNSGADLLATDAGFWLVSSPPTGDARMAVRHAADGRNWSPGATESYEIPGNRYAVGLLGGQPTAVVGTGTGERPDLISLQVLGTTSARSIDVTSALGPDLAAGWLTHPAIGPRGFAAVLQTDRDSGTPRNTLVHSIDGTTFSITEVPEAPSGRTERVAGVSVTADAVSVRLQSRPLGEAQEKTMTTPATTRLFVGTPR